MIFPIAFATITAQMPRQDVYFGRG